MLNMVVFHEVYELLDRSVGEKEILILPQF